MEQTHDLLNNDLQINSVTENYLTESAKWGKFLAIIGFIYCVLLVIIAFVMGNYAGNIGAYSSNSSAVSTTIIIVYILFAIILFFPCMFLYKFSTKMQQALKSVNQEAFEASLQNLKALFKFQGILAIIIIVLSIISMLGVLAKGI